MLGDNFPLNPLINSSYLRESLEFVELSVLMIQNLFLFD